VLAYGRIVDIGTRSCTVITGIHARRWLLAQRPCPSFGDRITYLPTVRYTGVACAPNNLDLPLWHPPEGAVDASDSG
jgi:hypothetical protein